MTIEHPTARTLREENSKLKNQLKELTDEISSLTNKLKKDPEDLEDQIDQLQSDLERKEEELAEVLEEIDYLDSEFYDVIRQLETVIFSPNIKSDYDLSPKALLSLINSWKIDLKNLRSRIPY